MQIKINVDAQRLTLSSNTIVSGTNNFVECAFTFSTDWAELDKWALFKCDNNTYEMYITDNKCIIPTQCIAKQGVIVMSVVGRSDGKNITATAEDKLLVVNGRAFDGEGEERLTETYLEETLSSVQSIHGQVVENCSTAEKAAKKATQEAAKSESSAQRSERAAAGVQTINDQLDRAETLATQTQQNADAAKSAATAAQTASKECAANAQKAVDAKTDAENKAGEASNSAKEALKSQSLAAEEASKAATAAATALEAVEWRYTAGVKFTPAAAAGTRLGAAENLTWEKSTDIAAGRDDFPAKFNCYNTYEALVKNGKIVATEGSYEFERYKDDDEYDADVFVMFPKGYAKRYYDGEGNEVRLVSDKKISGYIPSPMHFVEGNEYDVVGVTKYGWCDDGKGGLCSRAGKPKLVYNTWQNYESKSVARGAGIHAISFADITWLQHLGCIKYANRNWQTAVGNGVTNTYLEKDKSCTVSQENKASIIIDNDTASKFAVGEGIYLAGMSNVTGIKTRKILSIEAYDENNMIVSVDGPGFTSTAGSSGFSRSVSYSGSCDAVLGLDGEIAGGVSGKKSVLTLGIENLYANDWKLLGNAFRVGADLYINPKPLTAAAWPSSVEDAVAKGWVRVDTQLPDKEGYVNELCYDSSYPLISTPKSVGGNSSNPVGDYFYRNDTTDQRIVLFGGGFSNGSSCGPFYFYVNNWLGDSWWSYGSLGVYRPL